MARALLGTLAAVIFLRVLGVSLLLAGFLDYALGLGGTPWQAGLAFGAYPLALAAFMLPLGELSDRIGRRAVLVGGLVVSAVGGVLAAFAPNVLLLGLGRFVQGAGAVNSVVLALAGEIGAPEERTRRFAVVGAAAGGGFVGGIVLGAWLLPFLGIPGLLVAHSVLSLLLVPAVLRTVPSMAREPMAAVGGVEARAIALGVAGLAVNLSMTGLLFLSPRLLADESLSYGVLVTLMVLPAGFGMYVASRMADRGRAGAVGAGAALLLGLMPLAFVFDTGLVLLVGAGMAYFIGHSSLMSLLPSLTARHSAGRGGRAQGIQSTLQYLGSFLGATVVGALFGAPVALSLVFVAAGVVVAAVVLPLARPGPGQA